MSEETRKELSEEELQNVSGGGCSKTPDAPQEPELQDPQTGGAPTVELEIGGEDLQ